MSILELAEEESDRHGGAWNLPAAVGIALAERDSGRNRPVIVVIGDGSFQYSIQSLRRNCVFRL